MDLVYICTDVEHLGNNVTTNPLPFSIGLSIMVPDDPNNWVMNTQGKIIPVPKYQVQYNLDVTDPKKTPNPDTLVWWKQQDPQVWIDVTKNPQPPYEVANLVVEHLNFLFNEYKDRLVILVDNYIDVAFIDRLLQEHGFNQMTYYTGTRSPGRVMNVKDYINGVFRGLEVAQPSMPENGLYRNLADTLQLAPTQHTHRPAEDSRRDGERMCLCLKWERDMIARRV